MSHADEPGSSHFEQQGSVDGVSCDPESDAAAAYSATQDESLLCWRAGSDGEGPLLGDGETGAAESQGSGA